MEATSPLWVTVLSDPQNTFLDYCALEGLMLFLAHTQTRGALCVCAGFGSVPLEYTASIEGVQKGWYPYNCPFE